MYRIFLSTKAADSLLPSFVYAFMCLSTLIYNSVANIINIFYKRKQILNIYYKMLFFVSIVGYLQCIRTQRKQGLYLFDIMLCVNSNIISQQNSCTPMMTCLNNKRNILSFLSKYYSFLSSFFRLTSAIASLRAQVCLPCLISSSYSYPYFLIIKF